MNVDICPFLLVCHAVQADAIDFRITQRLHRHKPTVTLNDHVVFVNGNRVIESKFLYRFLDLLDLFFGVDFCVIFVWFQIRNLDFLDLQGNLSPFQKIRGKFQGE